MSYDEKLGGSIHEKRLEELTKQLISLRKEHEFERQRRSEYDGNGMLIGASLSETHSIQEKIDRLRPEIEALLEIVPTQTKKKILQKCSIELD